MTNLDGLLALHQSTYVALDRAVAWVLAPDAYAAVGRAVYRVVHPSQDVAVFRAVNDDLSHLGLEIYLGEVGR